MTKKQQKTLKTTAEISLSRPQYEDRKATFKLPRKLKVAKGYRLLMVTDRGDLAYSEEIKVRPKHSFFSKVLVVGIIVGVGYWLSMPHTEESSAWSEADVPGGRVFEVPPALPE